LPAAAKFISHPWGKAVQFNKKQASFGKPLVTPVARGFFIYAFFEIVLKYSFIEEISSVL
jgi:hypothetical protein